MADGLRRVRGNPLAKFLKAIALIFLTVLLGTLGYIIIEGWSFLDAIFMTVITLSTVGFGEVDETSPAGRIFTMLLIGFGVAVAVWALSVIIRILATEEPSDYVTRWKMQQTVDKIRGHFVICGFGRMGKQIAADLTRRRIPIVVVEDNPEQKPALDESGYPYVEGDAMKSEVLMAAGVQQAKGLVSVAASDPINVFIVLTARGLNPDMYIVARSVFLESEEKLRRAGADKVVSPYVLGGHRIAAAVIYPAVVDFLDQAMHSDELDLELGEAHIEQHSTLAGGTLETADLGDTYGVNLVAIRKGASYLPQPHPKTSIDPGDVLVVVGTADQIERLACDASPNARR
jgi:voltage-gated potassium channel